MRRRGGANHRPSSSVSTRVRWRRTTPRPWMAKPRLSRPRIPNVTTRQVEHHKRRQRQGETAPGHQIVRDHRPMAGSGVRSCASPRARNGLPGRRPVSDETPRIRPPRTRTHGPVRPWAGWPAEWRMILRPRGCSGPRRSAPCRRRRQREDSPIGAPGPDLASCRGHRRPRFPPSAQLSSPLHDDGAPTGGPRSIPLDRLAPRDSRRRSCGRPCTTPSPPFSRPGSGTSGGRRPSFLSPSPSRWWCRRRWCRSPGA